MNNDFNNVQEYSTTDALREISFPVERRELVTKNPEEQVHYKMVHRQDTNEDLGIVKDTYPKIAYKDIMKWLIKEFEEANLKYKLRDSVVQKKGDMYQEYLFNRDVDTPDGSSMVPLVICKASYTSTPLEIYFGTYRFVCSNGVMVGNTVEKIHVGPKNQDILQSSIKDDIKQSLSKFSDVSNLYKQLEDESFQSFLNSFLTDYYVTAGFKKAVLQELVNSGNVEVLKKKLKQEDFNHDTLESVYRIIDDTMNGWTFYNIITNVVTRKSRSVGARLKNYNSVSRIFGI